MEVRKLLTLMFFLFTSMLLLVHAVLPHYHHNKIICFSVEKQCPNLFNSDNNSACCNKHIHQETHQHDSLEDCDLKRLVIRQDNTLDDDLISFLNLFSGLYVLYSLNTFFLEAPEFGLKKQEKPFLNNYKSTLYGLDLSLRGPPTFFLS